MFIPGKETLSDNKWSDTLGTDTDQLNQAFVSTTDTDTTKKQIAAYPAGTVNNPGNVTCTFKYSFSGVLRTFSHTFQIHIEGVCFLSFEIKIFDVRGSVTHNKIRLKIEMTIIIIEDLNSALVI